LEVLIVLGFKRLLKKQRKNRNAARSSIVVVFKVAPDLLDIASLL